MSYRKPLCFREVEDLDPIGNAKLLLLSKEEKLSDWLNKLYKIHKYPKEFFFFLQSKGVTDEITFVNLYKRYGISFICYSNKNESWDEYLCEIVSYVNKNLR